MSHRIGFRFVFKLKSERSSLCLFCKPARINSIILVIFCLFLIAEAKPRDLNSTVSSNVSSLANKSQITIKCCNSSCEQPIRRILQEESIIQDEAQNTELHEEDSNHTAANHFRPPEISEQIVEPIEAPSFITNQFDIKQPANEFKLSQYFASSNASQTTINSANNSLIGFDSDDSAGENELVANSSLNFSLSSSPESSDEIAQEKFLKSEKWFPKNGLTQTAAKQRPKKYHHQHHQHHHHHHSEHHRIRPKKTGSRSQANAHSLTNDPYNQKQISLTINNALNDKWEPIKQVSEQKTMNKTETDDSWKPSILETMIKPIKQQTTTTTTTTSDSFKPIENNPIAIPYFGPTDIKYIRLADLIPFSKIFRRGPIINRVPIISNQKHHGNFNDLQTSAHSQDISLSALPNDLSLSKQLIRHLHQLNLSPPQQISNRLLSNNRFGNRDFDYRSQLFASNQSPNQAASSQISQLFHLQPGLAPESSATGPPSRSDLLAAIENNAQFNLQPQHDSINSQLAASSIVGSSPNEQLANSIGMADPFGASALAGFTSQNNGNNQQQQQMHPVGIQTDDGATSADQLFNQVLKQLAGSQSLESIQSLVDPNLLQSIEGAIKSLAETTTPMSQQKQTSPPQAAAAAAATSMNSSQYQQSIQQPQQNTNQANQLSHLKQLTDLIGLMSANSPNQHHATQLQNQLPTDSQLNRKPTNYYPSQQVTDVNNQRQLAQSSMAIHPGQQYAAMVPQQHHYHQQQNHQIRPLQSDYMADAGESGHEMPNFLSLAPQPRRRNKSKRSRSSPRSPQIKMQKRPKSSKSNLHEIDSQHDLQPAGTLHKWKYPWYRPDDEDEEEGETELNIRFFNNFSRMGPLGGLARAGGTATMLVSLAFLIISNISLAATVIAHGIAGILRNLGQQPERNKSTSRERRQVKYENMTAAIPILTSQSILTANRTTIKHPELRERIGSFDVKWK